MSRNYAFSMLFAGLIVAAPASAADVIKAEPVKAEGGKPLQFSDLGGVRSWKSGGPDIVFVKSKTEQWYRAELAQTCMVLDTKKGVTFLTETIPETTSKVSKVMVGRDMWEVTSLTKVDAPTTSTR